MELTPCRNPLRGHLRPPSDKSVTHRAILFSALAPGACVIEHPLIAADTLSSRHVVESLGVTVRAEQDRWILQSPGPQGWSKPQDVLDCGNSGTTMRLAMGLLAAGSGRYQLSGDDSLSARPMERVARPLRSMGIAVETQDGHAPVTVQGGVHHGTTYVMPVASAQVKSAILLAAVTALGATRVQEPYPTRDYTERMLRAMGAQVQHQEGFITVEPSSLHLVDTMVPGDPSSAAFWAALAALIPGSDLTLREMSISPRRMGFYRLLQAMGAMVTTERKGAEGDVGDIRVAPGQLAGVTVLPEDIPDMIDEVPLLALVATQAQGETVISGAHELRVKESDRIAATVKNLRALGARIEEREDGMVIHGPTRLHGASVEAAGDHRMAMMLAVAAAVADGPVFLEGAQHVAISYPDFFTQYHQWTQGQPFAS